MECYCTDNKCMPCMIEDGEFEPDAHIRMIESHAALVEVAKHAVQVACHCDRYPKGERFQCRSCMARAALALAGKLESP